MCPGSVLERVNVVYVDGDVVLVDESEQIVAVGDELVARDDVIHECWPAEFVVFGREFAGGGERRS